MVAEDSKRLAKGVSRGRDVEPRGPVEGVLWKGREGEGGEGGGEGEAGPWRMVNGQRWPFHSKHLSAWRVS